MLNLVLIQMRKLPIGVSALNPYAIKSIHLVYPGG